MIISVVIPTYNRLPQLKLTLAQLEVQNFPVEDYEVIIVSDGSTDGTDEFLMQYSPKISVKAIFQQNAGPAVARNCGVHEAKGKYILFLDDDVVPTPELVIEHLNFHDRNGKKVVVIGPMLTPPDHRMSPWVAWEQNVLEKQYEDMIQGKYMPTARQFYTGNASLERNLFIEHGGFNTSFRRAEDVEFAYRLARNEMTFVFNPDAIGYHYAERSLQSWMETPYSYGKSNVIFARDLGNDWLIPATVAEFHERHKYIQILVKLCLGRNQIKNVFIRLLLLVGNISCKFGLNSISRMAYSGLFNLQYYQGFSEQLGGRDLFMKMVSELR